MSEIKLCKDCKHFYGNLNNINNSPFNFSYPSNHCMRNITYKTDLVDGYKRITGGDYLSCYEQRAEISYVQDRCGVLGKFFEAK